MSLKADAISQNKNSNTDSSFKENEVENNSSEFLNLQAAVTSPVESSCEVTLSAAQKTVSAGMPQFMQEKVHEKQSQQAAAAKTRESNKPTQIKVLQLDKLTVEEVKKTTDKSPIIVVEQERKKHPKMIEEIKREVEVSKRFKSMARGENTPIYVDQDLRQMIGDQTSILSNNSSESDVGTSNYSIPQIEEDQVTGSQFSAFVLSSGGINAICSGSNHLIGSGASPVDPLTGSLSNRERQGTLISNYISEEQGTDTYLVSDDSLVQRTRTPREDEGIKTELITSKS